VTQPIALISDFGYRDAYVGIMKSVIHRINPAVRMIDLCHEVPAHNVLSGSYLLATSAPFLPEKSIVLGVVDPGVGTSRRAVAVETEDLLLVGPDNGLFNMIYERQPPQRSVVLDNPDFHLDRVSKTFHGRDIFSPCAAHLSTGKDLEEIGTPIATDSLVRLPEIGPLLKEHGIECRIVHIDHFGNVVTNLSRTTMEAAGKTPEFVRVGETRAPFAETFADVSRNDPVAYFNSTNFLEIGIRNGSAADQLELKQRYLIHLETQES